MPTLIDLLAEMEATLAAVPSVENASTAYLAKLTTSVEAAHVRSTVVREMGDVMLGAAGAPSKFLPGLNPLITIVNVSNLLVGTAVMPYLLDIENQLVLIGRAVASVAEQA